ncbi:MAG: hypothetical protein JWL84_4956 [Rhodospirillales bacterium]|jgi:hypothetical protein|nr:hypothetical protein [Rhodospirillales bacterium]
MADDKKVSGQANEGEGNKTAARHYDKAQAEFAKSGKVADAARQAREAVDGPEGKELEKAEATGKSHSAGEDPALKR